MNTQNQSKPVDTELMRIGDRIRKLLPTPGSEASTSSARPSSSPATGRSVATTPKPNEAGELLGETGATARLNLPPGTTPWRALERHLAGLPPQQRQWLREGPKRQPVMQPGGSVAIKLTPPPRSWGRQMLATHDLLTLVLAERMTSEQIAEMLDGLTGSLRTRATTKPGEQSWAVWAHVLLDLPAHFLQEAVLTWVRREPWMPTPADLQQLTDELAEPYRRMHRHTAKILSHWHEEQRRRELDLEGGRHA